MTNNGIIPAITPKTVALAPSPFAYSTMGLLRTIWKESALNAENKNALCRPGGNEPGFTGGFKAVSFWVIMLRAFDFTRQIGYIMAANVR